MHKVRIVFNSFNLDAIAATTQIVNCFHFANLNENSLNPKYVIETVPHSPVYYTPPNSEYDFIFHIGVLMNKLEIKEEANKTNNYFYIGYGQFDNRINHSDFHGAELQEYIGDNAHVITSSFMFDEIVPDSIDNHFGNLTLLSSILMKKYFNEIESISKDDVLYSTIAKYSWGQDPYIWKTFTDQQLGLVHANIEHITKAAFSNTVLNSYTPFHIKENEKQNSVRTIKTRSIINKGLAEHIYGNQKISIRVQSLNCSEEYVQDLARLISRSTDNAVFYQDNKHSRQWWVCGNDKDKISEIIPYYRKHYDRGFIYLVSDMPRMTEK